MTSGPRRLLLLGWDGGSWNALDPWMERGLLPNVRALTERGLRCGLRSTAPPVTPAAWTSLATGLRPDRTGVLGFRHLDLRRPSGYSSCAASSADLRGKTLFEHALRLGESVALVGWPMTWPPFPLPGGVLLSGWPRPDRRHAPTWPAALGRRLGPWSEGAPGVRARGWTVEEAISRAAWYDRRHAEVGCRWLRQRDDRITAVVFSGFDHLAHRLWGDERLAEHAARLDRHVGALVDAAGPGAGVMLISDHGFAGAPTRRVHLDRWLEREGWSTRRADRAPGEDLAGRLRAAVPAPLWRRAREALPAGLRRRAYERARGLGALDLPACRAVRVPLHEGWDGVHLLIRGRTQGATLDPRDAPAALARLERALLAARLPLGRPLVAGTERSNPSPGLVARLPDLILDYGGDHQGGHGRGEGPLEDPVPPEELRRFPGAHRREGLLLMAGPGLTGVPPSTPSVEDVLPTALAWLGLPLPDDRDGAVLQGALSCAPRYTAPLAPLQAGSTPQRPVATTELEALGYLR